MRGFEKPSQVQGCYPLMPVAIRSVGPIMLQRSMYRPGSIKSFEVKAHNQFESVGYAHDFPDGTYRAMVWHPVTGVEIEATKHRSETAALKGLVKLLDKHRATLAPARDRSAEMQSATWELR